MEINEYRPKQSRLHKAAASEYEASQVKTQHIKPSAQDQKPLLINRYEHSIIKGEIIDLRYQEVKIRLEPNGQVITARLSGELPLSIGQTAEFVVSDETDGQITLRYIQTGDSPVNDILHKALYASGLTASNRNLAIVQELLNNQMPVDKNTILKLIKLTSTHADVNPSTLVLMNKNDLPINTSNIAQFEAYQKGMHQILTQLKSLIGHINNIRLNNINSTNIDSTIDQANLPTNVLSDNIQSNNVVSSSHSSNVINIYKELVTLLTEENGGREQISPDTTIGHVLSNKNMMELMDIILGKISESTFYNSEEVENIQNQLSNGSMTLDNLLAIFHDLYSNGSSKPLSVNIMLQVHITSAFINMSSHLSAAKREKLVQLLVSDAYREIMTEALHQRWTLSPRELIKKNKIKDFFINLDKDMERLDKMTDDFNMSSDVKSIINKLQDNLQFMKDLNELFLYLQLPIRFKEEDAHGDLYVFTRKNQKHHDTEKLNVLLHLDMANLGSMDIHMSMMNRQVNAVFYVEKSSEQIITKHLYELINTLKEKGYQLQAKTQISESKPDFITDILQQNTHSPTIHRYTFDIRA